MNVGSLKPLLKLNFFIPFRTPWSGDRGVEGTFVILMTFVFSTFIKSQMSEYAIRTPHFFPPRIYLFKNVATNGRIVSFCQKWRLEPPRTVFVGAEFSFPPLGVVVSFGGEDVAQFGMVDITDWACWKTGSRTHVTLTMPVLHVNGDMPLLFGTDDEVERQRDNHAVGCFAPFGTGGIGSLGAIVRRGDDRAAATPSGDIVVLDTNDPKVAGWLSLQEQAVRRPCPARARGGQAR